MGKQNASSSLPSMHVEVFNLAEIPGMNVEKLLFLWKFFKQPNCYSQNT